MLAHVSSERLPATVATRVIDVTRRDRSVAELRSDVDHIRAIAAAPPSRVVRRFMFLWFRVFVSEKKHGKAERVNVRIPIPIPLIGGLFPPGLSRAKALRALAIAESADDPATAMSDYLDSVMGFELVRVDERKGEDHRSLVVVGFD
jgi:hypothetical protein